MTEVILAENFWRGKQGAGREFVRGIDFAATVKGDP